MTTYINDDDDTKEIDLKNDTNNVILIENDVENTIDIESKEKTALMMSEQEQINLVDTLNKLTQCQFENNDSDENFDGQPLTIMENHLRINLNEYDNNNNDKSKYQNESYKNPIIVNATGALMSSDTNFIQQNKINNSYSCNVVDSSTITPPQSTSRKTVEKIVNDILQNIVINLSDSFDLEESETITKQSNNKMNTQKEIDSNDQSNVSDSFVNTFWSIYIIII
jgi:hypothetical protein